MKKLAVAFFLLLSVTSSAFSVTKNYNSYTSAQSACEAGRTDPYSWKCTSSCSVASSICLRRDMGVYGWGEIKDTFTYEADGDCSPQATAADGQCVPKCQSNYQLNADKTACVPECGLRQSKDSSGACVADVPPVAGSEVPSNGQGGGSLSDPGHVGWNDKTTTEKTYWGGGTACIGGWEYQYAGGMCIPSGGTDELNCVNYDAKYTGNSCESESTDTPSGGTSTMPGSTSGTSCDAGYTQGSITINGVTTITCTKITTTNPGTGGNGSTGGNGTTSNCGGTGQSPCTVTIAEPTSGVPGGLDASAFSSFEQAAAEHKGLFDQIAAGGNAGGLLSWAMLPEVPSYACVDPSGMFDGHVVGFSGWCEKAVLIRDFLAYVLWLGLLYAVFHIVTTSASGK